MSERVRPGQTRDPVTNAASQMLCRNWFLQGNITDTPPLKRKKTNKNSNKALKAVSLQS